MNDITELLAQATRALEQAESALSQAKELLGKEKQVLLQIEALIERYRALRGRIPPLKTKYLSHVIKTLAKLHHRDILFEKEICGYGAFHVDTYIIGRVRLLGAFEARGSPIYSCSELARYGECEGLYQAIITLAWKEIAKFPSTVIAEATKSESVLHTLCQELALVLDALREIVPSKT